MRVSRRTFLLGAGKVGIGALIVPIAAPLAKLPEIQIEPEWLEIPGDGAVVTKFTLHSNGPIKWQDVAVPPEFNVIKYDWTMTNDIIDVSDISGRRILMPWGQSRAEVEIECVFDYERFKKIYEHFEALKPINMAAPAGDGWLSGEWYVVRQEFSCTSPFIRGRHELTKPINELVEIKS